MPCPSRTRPPAGFDTSSSYEKVCGPDEGAVPPAGLPWVGGGGRRFDRVAGSAGGTVVAGARGGGKRVLGGSGRGGGGLEASAAGVPVGPGGRAPQRFWRSVLGARRGTSGGWALRAEHRQPEPLRV